MKKVSDAIKSRISQPPPDECRSLRKQGLPPGWFAWLGMATYLLAKDFDHRVDVEFEETHDAFRIKVRVTEEPK